jgi:hypothetical protein
MVRGNLKDPEGAIAAHAAATRAGRVDVSANAFQVGGSAQIVADQTRVFGVETPTEGYTTAKLFASYSFEARRRSKHDHGAPRQRPPTRCIAIT